MWHYTPEEVFAHYELRRKDRRDELRENLIVGALAASGDKDAIEKLLNELSDG